MVTKYLMFHVCVSKDHYAEDATVRAVPVPEVLHLRVAVHLLALAFHRVLQGREQGMLAKGKHYLRANSI